MKNNKRIQKNYLIKIDKAKIQIPLIFSIFRGKIKVIDEDTALITTDKEKSWVLMNPAFLLNKEQIKELMIWNNSEWEKIL